MYLPCRPHVFVFNSSMCSQSYSMMDSVRDIASISCLVATMICSVSLRAIPRVLHSAHVYLMCLDVAGSALVLVGAVVAVKEAVEGDKLPVER